MTDEQILKSLECCSTGESIHCVDDLAKGALDLINRQKVKIEKLETARQKQGRLLREERAQKYELIDKLSSAKVEAVLKELT